MTLSDLKGLQHQLAITFKSEDLLQQAFIHSSYINENPGYAIADNERLEFLGDALLSCIVAEELYHKFPDFSEGELTEIRASLIRQETLADIATELELGNHLLLGRGEEITGGRRKRTNLADALEALIGAIYIDQGADVVRNFVLSRLSDKILKAKVTGIGRNYKALLQELTQAKYKKLPSYRTVEASGPDHDKKFVVVVMLDSMKIGSGSGKTKRAAEMEAARSAWEQMSTE
jgi:ribonuclease-3